MMLSKFFLSRSMKIVDDLHDSWNLRVFAGLLLVEGGMMVLVQHLETHWEMGVGASEEMDLRKIARQGQATRW